MITGGRDWIDTGQLAMYLNEGYTVVAVDYRLAPEHKLETIVADVEAAYGWLVQEGHGLLNIDPQQVAVVGHSAGGYLALLTGFRVEPRPKALVAFYGYGDLTGEWAVQPSNSYNQTGTITKDRAENSLRRSRRICVPTGSQLEGRFDYYVYGRQRGTWPLEISGHDPLHESEWFRPYEPLHNVTVNYPPTLLLHGQSDTDVPFTAAGRMVDALETAGVPFELITNAT
jgi:acetyl esterase/lipase